MSSARPATFHNLSHEVLETTYSNTMASFANHCVHLNVKIAFFKPIEAKFLMPQRTGAHEPPLAAHVLMAHIDYNTGWLANARDGGKVSWDS